MNRILSTSLLATLLLAGCVSANLDNYHAATFEDIQAKRRANTTNQADFYNRWYYAGSDDKYDYIYEYEKGISVTPPSNFHYYKVPRGQIENLPGRFPFKPDLKANPEIFAW